MVMHLPPAELTGSFGTLPLGTEEMDITVSVIQRGNSVP